MSQTINFTPQEEINRYRRSVLINSCLYYFMDSPIISDKQYDIMARKLHALHTMYPEVAKTCIYQEAFKDFDPATGFDLPIDDSWVVNKAYYLIRVHQQREQGKPVEEVKQDNTENILMSLDLNNLFL